MNKLDFLNRLEDIFRCIDVTQNADSIAELWQDIETAKNTEIDAVKAQFYALGKRDGRAELQWELRELINVPKMEE